jgi:hypothetical protein
LVVTTTAKLKLFTPMLLPSQNVALNSLNTEQKFPLFHLAADHVPLCKFVYPKECTLFAVPSISHAGAEALSNDPLFGSRVHMIYGQNIDDSTIPYRSLDVHLSVDSPQLVYKSDRNL